jgi:hypothetical protein
MHARLGPRGPKTTMSAVAARGTVEMLSAPERVKVSTDGPSQPSSLSLAGSTIWRYPNFELLLTLRRPSIACVTRGGPRHIVLWSDYFVDFVKDCNWRHCENIVDVAAEPSAAKTASRPGAAPSGATARSVSLRGRDELEILGRHPVEERLVLALREGP